MLSEGLRNSLHGIKIHKLILIPEADSPGLTATALVTLIVKRLQMFKTVSSVSLIATNSIQMAN